MADTMINIPESRISHPKMEQEWTVTRRKGQSYSLLFTAQIDSQAVDRIAGMKMNRRVLIPGNSVERNLRKLVHGYYDYLLPKEHQLILGVN